MFAMRFGSLGLVGVGLALVGGSAGAQVPISLGGRAGQSVVVSGAKTWSTGFSVDLVGAYRINPTISAYLRAGGTDIGTHEDAESIDLSVYSTTVGMSMLMGPFGVGRPAPWVSGGVGLYSLSATRGFPNLDEQSRTRVGFDVGAGIAVAPSPKWHVTPAVRLAMFTADLRFDDETVSRTVGTVGYLIFDVGIMYDFGVRTGR